MKGKKLIFCIVVILFWVHKLHSQSVTNEIWTSIKLEKKLNKSFSLNLNPEYRFGNENYTQKILIDGGINYMPFKFVELGAKYRFKKMQETENEFSTGNEFAFDVKALYPINRFKINARLRYTNYSESENMEMFSNPYLRYRIETGYKVKNKKLKPVLSIEAFYQINDSEFNKLRAGIGFDYKINKKNEFNFAYYKQSYLKKELGKNIFSINYKLKF